jgi:hypothetical protein
MTPLPSACAGRLSVALAAQLINSRQVKLLSKVPTASIPSSVGWPWSSVAKWGRAGVVPSFEIPFNSMSCVF